MWFQLNTTFSTHLGALSTLQSNYGVTYSLSNFTKTTAPDMVEKDKSLTVVLKMVEGATFTSATMTDGTTSVTGTLASSDNTVTMTIAQVKGPVTVIARAASASVTPPPSGGDTKYTITYQYMCNGTSIKTATTEQVSAGTTKTFSTSSAPAITGYTVSSVSPTSATIDKNTTVTYNYTANAASGTIVQLISSNTNSNYNDTANHLIDSQVAGSALGKSSVGTKGIYGWDIPANALVSLTVSGGGNYGMAITDTNDIVLEGFNSSTVGGAAGGQGTYTFSPVLQASRLYVSTAKFVSASYTILTEEELKDLVIFK